MSPDDHEQKKLGLNIQDNEPNTNRWFINEKPWWQTSDGKL